MTRKLFGISSLLRRLEMHHVQVKRVWILFKIPCILALHLTTSVFDGVTSFIKVLLRQKDFSILHS